MMDTSWPFNGILMTSSAYVIEGRFRYVLHPRIAISMDVKSSVLIGSVPNSFLPLPVLLSLQLQ